MQGLKYAFKADCVGGDVMMNSKKWLNDNGFIVRHIKGDWYLVRLYGDKRNPLYHIIFPMKLT